MGTLHVPTDSIEFSSVSNYLVTSRQAYCHSGQTDSPTKMGFTPFGVRIRETRDDRSLKAHSVYSTKWANHQAKHEKFFKNEAIKTRFPNPSTFDGGDEKVNLMQ
jgi:hypothetical protein